MGGSLLDLIWIQKDHQTDSVFERVPVGFYCVRGKNWPNEMGFNETLTIKHTFVIMDGGSMNILVDFVAVL